MRPQCCYQIATKCWKYPRQAENSESRKSLTCGSLLLARATGLEPATTGSTVRWAEETRGRTIPWKNGSFPCPGPGCGKHPSPHEDSFSRGCFRGGQFVP